MKIKGQHGEFGNQTTTRQIEICDNERIEVFVKDKKTGEKCNIIDFFMAGVLTLTWEVGQSISNK